MHGRPEITRASPLGSRRLLSAALCLARASPSTAVQAPSLPPRLLSPSLRASVCASAPTSPAAPAASPRLLPRRTHGERGRALRWLPGWREEGVGRTGGWDLRRGVGAEASERLLRGLRGGDLGVGERCGAGGGGGDSRVGRQVGDRGGRGRAVEGGSLETQRAGQVAPCRPRRMHSRPSLRPRTHVSTPPATFLLPAPLLPL